MANHFDARAAIVDICDEIENRVVDFKPLLRQNGKSYEKNLIRKATPSDLPLYDGMHNWDGKRVQ